MSCSERLVVTATRVWDLGQCVRNDDHVKHLLVGTDPKGGTYCIEWEGEYIHWFRPEEADA